MKASRSDAGGAFFSTNPPFDPTGTMTVFFTFCALTRPSTSVRKSSGLSDQRSPPRATLPPRRWMPSKRGEYTQISNSGRGLGKPGTCAESSLKLRKLRRLANASSPSEWPTPVRQKLVRKVARISARNWRSTRSSDRLVTRAKAWSIALTCAAAPCSSRPAGASRNLNRRTSMRAMCGWVVSVPSMVACDAAKPICFRYLA